MYTRFFGLKQEPFSLAPDPRYLYMSKRHREALAHLLYGVGGGGGFVLLSGEIGAGKTTVCRCFLEQIPKRTNVAYIFNPKLTVIELLKAVCDEFRVPCSPTPGEPATVRTYVEPLNDFLLRTHAVGQNNVLIIDEAQLLPVDVLEQLRLLTNLETNERKLLQIVLIGQPELRTILEKPELEQLAQRVIARFHLKALSPKETEHYIRHRLSVAGMTRQIPFDRKALDRVHAIARGVPRRINLLCDRALLGAYAHGRPLVTAEIVEKAAREVFGKSEPVSPDRSRTGSSAGAVMVAVTLFALLALFAFAVYGAWRRYAAPEPVTAAASAASAPAKTVAAAISPTPAPTSAPTLALTPAPTPAPASAPASAAASTPAPTSTPAPSPAPASAPVNLGAITAPKPAANAVPAVAIKPARNLDASAWQAHLVTFGQAEKAAWAALAPMWGVTGTAALADPCSAGARSQVRCYTFRTTLKMVRALDRPGLMKVHTTDGRSTWVVVTAISDDAAAVRLPDGSSAQVELPALFKSWQGEFGTLWKAPPGYEQSLVEGARGRAVDALAAGLAKAAGQPAPAAGRSLDSALLAQLDAFQRAHGVSALGRAGPTTFMQLNRATGVDEPRLATVAGR